MKQDFSLIVALMKSFQRQWRQKVRGFLFPLCRLSAQIYVRLPESFLSSYNEPWEIGKVAAIDRRWPGNKSNQGWRGEVSAAAAAIRLKSSRAVNKRRNTFWGSGRGQRGVCNFTPSCTSPEDIFHAPPPSHSVTSSLSILKMIGGGQRPSSAVQSRHNYFLNQINWNLTTNQSVLHLKNFRLNCSSIKAGKKVNSDQLQPVSLQYVNQRRRDDARSHVSPFWSESRCTETDLQSVWLCPVCFARWTNTSILCFSPVILSLYICLVAVLHLLLWLFFCLFFG